MQTIDVFVDKDDHIVVSARLAYALDQPTKFKWRLKKKTRKDWMFDPAAGIVFTSDQITFSKRNADFDHEWDCEDANTNLEEMTYEVTLIHRTQSKRTTLDPTIKNGAY